MVFGRSLLDAVLGPLDACKGLGDGDVEDDGEVRPAGLDGDIGDGADLLFGEAVAADLIGEGGRDKAIADDGLAGGEGGEDDLGDHLGTGSHIEEHFAAHGHFGVSGVEENCADLLADLGGAWIADGEGLEMVFLEGFDEEFELGGLAGAFGAVEDDEAGTERMGVIVGHG